MPFSLSCAMIKLVLVVNAAGKVRLSKFYDPRPAEPQSQQRLTRGLHSRLAARQKHNCSFFDVSDLLGPDSTAVYRRYADLFVVFVADGAESPLATVDLIQEFVDAVDRCFGLACELDFVYHADQVHHILNEVLQGGLVLTVNSAEIAGHALEQQAAEDRQTRPLRAAAAQVLSSIQEFHVFHST
ncbi:uncharacterized protein LOC126210542 isoform X1 [Schistocerca nitens]|uniref:uncharacterized protein LOC126210542 isoform X1 n=1 Tax=Schistocerca nitens TaxID=7011 RepID=UPI002117AA15|nr:uncharacterized protein LOC126210542 isoform X1 [Schistocerca nitens]